MKIHISDIEKGDEEVRGKIEYSEIYEHLCQMVARAKEEDVNKDEAENEKLDLPTIMTILLKESILKMLKNIAPNLYNHRFYADIMLSVVGDYLTHNQNKKVDHFIKEITLYDSD